MPRRDAVITLLKRVDRATTRYLAWRMKVDPRGLSNTLRRLEEDGYIERRGYFDKVTTWGLETMKCPHCSKTFASKAGSNKPVVRDQVLPLLTESGLTAAEVAAAMGGKRSSSAIAARLNSYEKVGLVRRNGYQTKVVVGPAGKTTTHYVTLWVRQELDPG